MEQESKKLRDSLEDIKVFEYLQGPLLRRRRRTNKRTAMQKGSTSSIAEAFQI